MLFPTFLSLIITTVVMLQQVHGFSSTNLFITPKIQNSFLWSSSSSITSTTSQSATNNNDNKSDAFIFRNFNADATECDDNNHCPTLKTILKNIQQLTTQGSDIRGRFVDHPRLGRIGQAAKVMKTLGEQNSNGNGIPALTPVSAFWLGHAFAKLVIEEKQQQQQQQQQPLSGQSNDDDDANSSITTIAMGRDPRPHGPILCDAFSRGMLSADENIRVVYTGIATTPSMFHFCRAGMCDGAVMITASHLPSDRNGFKLFTKYNGGFTKNKVQQMNFIAQNFAQYYHDEQSGRLPATSGGDGVFCSEWVDFMPAYASTLKEAIFSEIQQEYSNDDIILNKPLQGLKIVLNAGNGSGGFFYQILKDLGADVSASINVEPNGDFPAGIPNPEKRSMIDETIKSCQQIAADIGILFDTDADRSGFVLPVSNVDNEIQYEPLNRNRLIALLSVIFSRSSPGCSIVTDSVTSEGLGKFLEEELGLQHIRYLKGYANVIEKAKELNNSGSANAEMAIETSGHCAMKENDFLDDGTYAAVKVIGLLAREKAKQGSNSNPALLGLISKMEEMQEEAEIRMEVNDGSLETTTAVFNVAANQIEAACNDSSLSWTLDMDNLEGIRVRTGNGGFFMLRKSLHDPLLSLQVESTSKQNALATVVKPLLQRFQSVNEIRNSLDMNALEEY